MQVIEELEVLVRAKFPIIYVQTWEEERVEATFASIAEKLKRSFHRWSITQNFDPPLRRTSNADPNSSGRLPLELEALAQIHESSDFNVIVLRDFHPYLKDNRVIRVLRDLASKLRSRSQTLVLIAPILTLPVELEKEVTVIEFPLPNRQDIEKLLDNVLSVAKSEPSINTELTPENREMLVKSAQGLTLDEIESVFARSFVEKRSLDVATVLEEKKQIVRKSGLLEYYEAKDSMKDVGGHELLKEWLEKRQAAFTDKAREFGIPAPKGVLLLGVQGCGKSLVAKAVASSWGLPLLKLDVGRIFGSLVGQSEENIRKAIRVAESVSPCALWADELEKGFAGTQSSGSSDGGTTARVFATFLSWMQDKTKPVFLISTANDVSKLPPELLRKGRFDEIFFIDLPRMSERKDIFAIHLRKRKREPEKFNLDELAEKTLGFSGAEIEQVVLGALHLAFFENRELEQKDLIFEAEHQVPLSRMMAEEIDELRTWAEMRARPSAADNGQP